MEAKSGAEAGAGARVRKEVDQGAFWATSLKQRNHCFPPSHFVNFGVRWTQHKITIRPVAKAKPLKRIGFSWIFWKSMWHDVAVRCRADRYKMTDIGSGR